MRASKLHLPNCVESIGLASDLVQQMSRTAGLPARETLQLMLATAEAVDNVVRHAFDPDETAEFELECLPVPLGLQVVVRDRGLPYDPEVASGRGLQLMQQSVHSCTFINLGIDGKAVELTQLRPARPVAELSSAGELEPFETTGRHSPLLAGEQIEIRQMRDDEALEVSRCIYRAYGYSYDNEFAYYPERLAELNRSGELHSAVAISSVRGMIGHAALIHTPGDPIGEVGMAVVRPDRRGLGVTRDVLAYLLEEARRRELLAVCSKAVTAHSASQRVLHALGFRDSGLLLGYVTSKTSFRGIAEKLEQRESLVLLQRVLVDRGEIRLYCPPRYQPLLAATFASLGMTVQLVAPPNVKPSSRQSIGFRVDGDVRHGKAQFEILRANIMTVELVRAQLRDLRLRKVEAMQLWLNLHDAAAVSLVDEFEQMGFFLAGVQPGWRGQDALILQYLNNVAIDFEQLKFDGDMAHQLASTIQQLVPVH